VDEPLAEVAFRLQVFYKSFNYPGVTRFINSFLKTKDANETNNFNPQILKQLNTNFRTLFIKSLEYGTDVLITLFNFFKKDLEITKKLLQIEENKTVYTSLFCSYKLDSKKYNSKPLKATIRPYLTDTEFEKFINGNNQKGVILERLYQINTYGNAYKNGNYPYIYHENYFFNNSILNNDDPLKVFHAIVNDLTKGEIKEFLKSSFHLFHKYEYSRTNIESNAFHKEIWDYIEEKFSDLEQKEILESFIDYFTISSIRTNIEFYSNKIVEYFGNETFEILGKYNFFLANFSPTNGHFLWNLFINHTTRNQQKAYLRAQKFKYDNLDTLLNILMISPLTKNIIEFSNILKIYESYFNATEMQEIILNCSADFLPLLTLKGKYKTYFITYLEKLFAGNQESLRKFLLKKIKPTKMDVFELLSDYNDYEGILKRLLNLINLSSNSSIEKFEEYIDYYSF